jgi:anti-sigma-K factor RskA
VLRREVVAWERRLAPLAESVDEVAPPPDLWPKIERSLRDALRPAWGSAEWRRGEGGRRRGQGGAASVLWRAWALGATAAAAALAGLLVLRPAPPPAAPRLVAVLSDAQARPAFLVSTAPGERRVAAESVTGLQPAGGDRVHELWVLPGGTGSPISLGVLDAAGRTARPLPDRVLGLLTTGRGVAVSLEPTGGSPTGAPTGPVVYTGVLLRDPL